MLPLVKKYFNEITDSQLNQLENYKNILLDWNSRVNLISRKDQDNFEQHHLLHSLAITKFYKFIPQQKVVDIGTGGGLPGIPLAIMFPQTEFILVDSRKNKIIALQEIVYSLQLNNVTIINARVESINLKYNLAIGRAVGDLQTMIGWITPNAQPLPSEPFLIYLKGDDIFNEIKSLNYKYVIKPIYEIIDLPHYKDKYVVMLYK
jgi:16S rRNA (guanine527-N7)-methyltransferase